MAHFLGSGHPSGATATNGHEAHRKFSAGSVVSAQTDSSQHIDVRATHWGQRAPVGLSGGTLRAGNPERTARLST